MKKFSFTLLLLAMAFLLAGQNPKYIFLFIGDGMSTPQRMLAEEVSRHLGKGKLRINTMEYHATTRTASASNIITDSAASATAIACGVKTTNGFLGVDPKKQPLESVADLAKKKGLKVGIITTVTLNHATPGGFYAKRPSRKMYYEIGLDLINSPFDYFGGGGIAKNDDKKSPLYKGDLYKLAAAKGFKVVRNSKEFHALRKGSGRVIAVGAPSSLPYAIDSRNSSIPTLAQYTAKGIELLDNPKGFFMMVEGGLIDYCGHANEGGANFREVLAFNDAVQKAFDFAAKHPRETLIIVTGDHETGGMTLGRSSAGLRVDYLALQKCSFSAFNSKVKSEEKKAGSAGKKLTFKDVQKMMTECFAFKFSKDAKEGVILLNAAEIKSLEKAFVRKQLYNAVRALFNQKSGVGWTTGGHTAVPVLTTASGQKAELFQGFIENTDIALKLKSLL
ncbi:MAG: alkaline phosphatase [Lentisphaeria bacterium]|nr:alkaline phosphatase [Lentisphaeria bacterium]